MTECISFFFLSICGVLQRFSYGLFCNNARSNFRLKRSGTNISCTYKCGLTTAINVSQKKYRVSRRSLRLSLSYQPKITFVSGLDMRALRRTTLSPFLSFLLHAIQEHSKIRTSLAKIPLNFIILSPCYLVALLRTLFIIRVLFVSFSLSGHVHFSVVPHIAENLNAHR